MHLHVLFIMAVHVVLEVLPPVRLLDYGVDTSDLSSQDKTQICTFSQTTLCYSQTCVEEGRLFLHKPW